MQDSSKLGLLLLILRGPAGADCFPGSSSFRERARLKVPNSGDGIFADLELLPTL